MKQTQESEDLIERYLLGELPVAERIALENEYLADKAKYDQVCRVEDDLLYRYARGALSQAERERVERQYLTNPWRRRHLEFAKALAQVIDGELATRSAAKRITDVSWRSQLGALPRGLRGSDPGRPFLRAPRRPLVGARVGCRKRFLVDTKEPIGKCDVLHPPKPGRRLNSRSGQGAGRSRAADRTSRQRRRGWNMNAGREKWSPR